MHAAVHAAGRAAGEAFVAAAARRDKTTDRTGNKNFVEVKGKADNQNCFEITIPEIEKAKQEKKFYHIIFVTNTLNEELRRIKYLGNLFMFEEGEDLLNNKRFSAVTKSYEIRFKE